MKDSFFSFRSYKPQKWIINTRGLLKEKVSEFLKSELGSKVEVSYLESKKGWLHDSKIISKSISTDLTMIWVEDHLFISDKDKLRKALLEMFQNNVDVLYYSWFHKGTKDFFYFINPIFNGSYIDSWTFDDKTINIRKKSDIYKNYYTIPLQSVMKTDFLHKILENEKPYLKRWPIKTPFDFEKKLKDGFCSSYKIGLPKHELFASIDDDHGHPGYSLISRNIYPDRMNRKEIQQMECKQKMLKDILKSNLPNYILAIVIYPYTILRRLKYTFNHYSEKIIRS